MIDRISQDILSELTEKKEFITAETLAKMLNLNEKTIRRKIKELNEFFPSDIFEIQSKRGYGFKCHVYDFVLYNELLNKASLELSANFASVRRLLIFEQLVDNPKPITKDEFLDQFYISEPTFFQDIKYINQLGSGFNVKIVIKPRKGYVLSGEEYDVRMFSLKLNSISHLEYGRRKQNEADIYKYLEAILEVLIEYRFEVSNDIVESILFYIFVSIRNVSKGRIISREAINQLPTFDKLKYFDLATVLHKLFDFDSPETEKEFLAYFLEGLTIRKKDDRQIDVGGVSEIIKSFLFNKIRIKVNIETLNKIDEYLLALDKRISLNLQKNSISLKDISAEYYASYILAGWSFKWAEINSNIRFTTAEKDYFTLFLNAILIDGMPKKIIGVLPQDEYLAICFKKELENLINHRIHRTMFEDGKIYLNESEKFAHNFDLIINPSTRTPNGGFINEVLIDNYVRSRDKARIRILLNFIDFQQLVKNISDSIVVFCNTVELPTSDLSEKMGDVEFYYDRQLMEYPLKCYIVRDEKKKSESSIHYFISSQLKATEIMDILFYSTALIKFLDNKVTTLNENFLSDGISFLLNQKNIMYAKSR